VNDQCKGAGDAADVRGKVPSRAEYVVSDYTTVKETGAQVRQMNCVRCSCDGAVHVSVGLGCVQYGCWLWPLQRCALLAGEVNLNNAPRERTLLRYI
jgi:hypothetical protein